MSDIEFRKIDKCEKCSLRKAEYLAVQPSFMKSVIRLLCEGCLNQVKQKEQISKGNW